MLSFRCNSRVKERYNVNEIYICRLLVPLLLKSNSTSLCNKRIENFLILLYKSMFFVFLGKKAFFCLYEKYVYSHVFFLCMIFAEITFCPSINLEQPVMVLVLFSYVSAKLRNAPPILSVPLSLLVLKEIPRPHFVHRLFVLINISLNIIYLVMYLCIFYVF